MNRTSSYFRAVRWVFASLVFLYLWWQGGVWRTIAYGGFVLLIVLGILLLSASKKR
jgi:hypothetical protein